jgi:signal transduction protein with GAF and PtsI domain
MDHFLSEIASIDFLSGLVSQGSIMLLDKEDCLRVYGSYNLHENVRFMRKVKLNEGFVGKVVQKGKVVWLDDLKSQAALEYGFEAERDYPYVAIMGRPINITGVPYRPIGVISLHFREQPTFSEVERKYIVNVLALYSQMITSVMQLMPDPTLSNQAEIFGGDEVAAGLDRT